MSAVLLVLLAVPLVGVLAAALAPEQAARGINLVASAGALVLSVVLAAGFDRHRGMQAVTDVPWVPAIGVRFHVGVDGISLPLIVLTALLSFLVAVHAFRHLPEPGRPRSYSALLLLLETGVLATFASLDVLLFFVAFEIVLVPMYALIAGWGGPRRRSAAIQFILFTLLGSAVMLLGLLAIKAYAGSGDLTALAHAHGAGMSRTVQDLVFAALLVGFGVKSPLWPLHTWLPDAHTEAPTAGSVLLAGVLLKMGTYGFVRVGLPVVPQGARDLAPLLGILATVGIVYGALACVAQTDAKRLVAYSSVGHMGFVLLGVASLTTIGVDAALIGNIAHGLITGLLFFLVGGLKDRYHTQTLAELGSGLRDGAPALAGLVTFAAVASLGLPGLAGFWGEILAIAGSFRPAPGLSVGLFRTLMAIAGVGTFLAAVYFMRLLRSLVAGPRVDGSAIARTAPSATAVGGVEWLAWAPLAALTIVVGLWPALVLAVGDPAVRALLGGG